MMKCEALKPIHHHKTMTILIHFHVHRWHCSFTVAGRRGPGAQSMTSSFSSSHNQKLANKIPTEFFAPQHHPNHLVLILEQDGRKSLKNHPHMPKLCTKMELQMKSWIMLPVALALVSSTLGLKSGKRMKNIINCKSKQPWS